MRCLQGAHGRHCRVGTMATTYPAGSPPTRSTSLWRIGGRAPFDAVFDNEPTLDRRPRLRWACGSPGTSPTPKASDPSRDVLAACCEGDTPVLTTLDDSLCSAQ